LTFNGLHDIISQKKEIFITTAVRTSDPTGLPLRLKIYLSTFISFNPFPLFYSFFLFHHVSLSLFSLSARFCIYISHLVSLYSKFFFRFIILSLLISFLKCVFLYSSFLQFSLGEATIISLIEQASLNILKYLRLVPEGDQLLFCMSQFSGSFAVNAKRWLIST
jgi:hypothetical protein